MLCPLWPQSLPTRNGLFWASELESDLVLIRFEGTLLWLKVHALCGTPSCLYAHYTRLHFLWALWTESSQLLQSWSFPSQEFVGNDDTHLDVLDDAQANQDAD